ncbi:hypothetical protein [Cellulomonas sp.]|uniref:hypothetical protein n=1 Tax=Cellulomonas sp. TaxID=40001 RepID=UPI002810C086|nr:hypothetical protein [Cellulomonas sp.]
MSEVDEMDPMGMGVLGVRLSRRQAESAEPWAPQVEETRHERRLAHRAARRSERAVARAHAPARVAAPRRAAAGALHRLADALAPTEQQGSRAVGHPAR